MVKFYFGGEAGYFGGGSGVSFGVIEADGPRLAYVASGTIKTDAVDIGQLPARLKIRR